MTSTKKLLASVKNQILGYANGARDVEIVWIPQDTEFVIQEYDGSETLITKDEFDWITA